MIRRHGISELGVAALAVVEDLEKSEYRVGQVDSGAPFLFGGAKESNDRLGTHGRLDETTRQSGTGVGSAALDDGRRRM